METTLMGGREVCVQRLWSEEDELVLLEGLGVSRPKTHSKDMTII